MAQNAQFAKWNLQIVSGGYTPAASLYLFHGALRLGLLSSSIEMYATIGLGIFVSKKEIYVTIVFGIFVLKNCTWPLHQEWFRGDGRIHPIYFKKIKSTFKYIAKIHALECKANLIENYF